jgi:glutathione S-transferase
MTRALKLYDLAASPNNIKVRCALRYKNLRYERIPVDPANREPLVRISGQPLSPVLLHGDTVVFDSYAIMRYLDANFRDTPRIYSEDRTTLKAIEAWELFARTDVGPGISMTFGQLRAEKPDADVLKKANDAMNRAASRLEEALAKGKWLVEGTAHPTAADFTVGTMMSLAAVSEATAAKVPPLAFFRKNIHLDRAPKTLDWIGRVMEFDR